MSEIRSHTHDALETTHAIACDDEAILPENLPPHVDKYLGQLNTQLERNIHIAVELYIINLALKILVQSRGPLTPKDHAHYKRILERQYTKICDSQNEFMALQLDLYGTGSNLNPISLEANPVLRKRLLQGQLNLNEIQRSCEDLINFIDKIDSRRETHVRVGGRDVGPSAKIGVV
jgi:hypothetical protein